MVRLLPPSSLESCTLCVLLPYFLRCRFAWIDGVQLKHLGRADFFVGTIESRWRPWKTELGEEEFASILRLSSARGICMACKHEGSRCPSNLNEASLASHTEVRSRLVFQ